MPAFCLLYCPVHSHSPVLILRCSCFARLCESEPNFVMFTAVQSSFLSAQNKRNSRRSAATAKHPPSEGCLQNRGTSNAKRLAPPSPAAQRPHSFCLGGGWRKFPPSKPMVQNLRTLISRPDLRCRPSRTKINLASICLALILTFLFCSALLCSHRPVDI